jgi:hypothetical protein
MIAENQRYTLSDEDRRITIWDRSGHGPLLPYRNYQSIVNFTATLRSAPYRFSVDAI